MVQIKVTPEMLEGVAKRAYGTRHALESIHKNLCDQIDHLCYQWTGASNQNFVQMFDDAKPKAFTFINGIANVEEELKQIAEKFRTADASYDGKVSDDNIEEGATCGPLNSEKKMIRKMNLYWISLNMVSKMFMKVLGTFYRALAVQLQKTILD